MKNLKLCYCVLKRCKLSLEKRRRGYDRKGMGFGLTCEVGSRERVYLSSVSLAL